MTYTVSGVEREYFIIDNKMSADPWYINFNSAFYVFKDPIFMAPDFAYPGFDINWNVLGFANTYYRGYSDVDWCIDDDWLCILDWDGFSVSGVKGSTDSFSVVIFDKSKVPMLTFNNQLDSYGVVGPVDAILGRSYTAADDYRSPFTYIGSSLFDSSGHMVFRVGGNMQSDNDGRWMLLNPFFSGTQSQYNYYTVDGTSINDLCVFPYARGFTPQPGLQRQLNVRLAISWAVPVDKCPAGTQVGDSWPKVKPIEVQMDDAYKAWMDSALQNTDYADSSNVGKDLADYNSQLKESDNWGTLATEGWNSIAPIFDSFDFVFVILGIAAVSYVLLLLIKKGMS